MGRSTSDERSQLAGEAAVGYEPPRLEELGTITELTHGSTGAAQDTITAGSAIPSDRRLKRAVVGVDPAAALEGLARLNLR